MAKDEEGEIAPMRIWGRNTAMRTSVKTQLSRSTQILPERKSPSGTIWFRHEWILCAAAIVVGLLQVWPNRHAIAIDGVSYVDMGDAFRRGAWGDAINGLWNPLYAILVAPALYVTADLASLEYPLVHLVTFVCFIGALFAFRFFLKQLLLQSEEAPGVDAVGSAHWTLLGYALFIWSSVDLIDVSLTSPDMLVAAFVYLATGLLLRISREPAAWWPYGVLGLTLGLAYLSKAFMFPGSLIFLVVAAMLTARKERASARLAIAVVVFMGTCLPWIGALSLQRHRLTFGETGHINYAWHVNNVQKRNWQGGPLGAGNPVHGNRKILSTPATYEFSSPLRVTYPPWYDPSYWYEGVKISFRPRQQARAVVVNLQELYSICLGLNGSFVIALLILVLLGPPWREVGRWLRRNWFVGVPSIVCVGLYLVVHLEGRYIGSFLTITFLWCFMALGAGGGDGTAKRVIRTIGFAALIMLMLEWAPRCVAVLVDAARGGDVVFEPANALQATRALGLMPGAKVATAGPANGDRGVVIWARLARVQIVAEVRTKENGRKSFWDLTPEEQAAAFSALKEVGATAIVSDSKPECRCAFEWSQLGKTEYYIHML